MARELPVEEREAMDRAWAETKAEDMRGVGLSKRGIHSRAWSAARAYHEAALAAREVGELLPTDLQRAKIEQEFANEQVRRLERTGRCPCCGAER